MFWIIALMVAALFFPILWIPIGIMLIIGIIAAVIDQSGLVNENSHCEINYGDATIIDSGTVWYDFMNRTCKEEHEPINWEIHGHSHGRSNIDAVPVMLKYRMSCPIDPGGLTGSISYDELMSRGGDWRLHLLNAIKEEHLHRLNDAILTLSKDK